MPPTLKRLKVHIALGLSYPSVLPSVTNFVGLKFHRWIPHQKISDSEYNGKYRLGQKINRETSQMKSPLVLVVCFGGGWWGTRGWRQWLTARWRICWQ